MADAFELINRIKRHYYVRIFTAPGDSLPKFVFDFDGAVAPDGIFYGILLDFWSKREHVSVIQIIVISYMYYLYSTATSLIFNQQLTSMHPN